MDKKIIILGAKGMLGTDLASVFSSYEPLLVDKKELDISNPKKVDDFIKKHGPEVVINAAAYTDVDGCEDNQDLCMEVNAEGPENLAKACKKNNCTLIHYSTDYIFNGQNQEGYDENYFNIDPVNVYGESKAEGEKAIMDNCTKYYIIRISWLYGKHGKNFVNTMLDLSKKNKELKVIDDQNGSPTYTKDVAERTKYIVDKQRELENGVYHVTNSKSCTWYEFAKEIFKIKNIKTKLTPCTSEEYPLPATRPEFSILLNTKLPKMRTWQEALKEYLA